MSDAPEQPFADLRERVAGAISVIIADYSGWINAKLGGDWYWNTCDRELQNECFAYADHVLAVLYSQPVAPEPDWATAPEWAEWAYLSFWTGLRTVSFRWLFTEREPERVDGFLLKPEDGYCEYQAQEIDLPLGIDWRTTLTERPREIK